MRCKSKIKEIRTIASSITTKKPLFIVIRFPIASDTSVLSDPFYMSTLSALFKENKYAYAIPLYSRVPASVVLNFFLVYQYIYSLCT